MTNAKFRTQRVGVAAPRFFARASEFRNWLSMHAAASAELIVGFYKVNTGKPSMSWSESVDEALCFGWIDGVRKRIDDEAYKIRFSPRKPDSIWSAVNIAKFKSLSAGGRMTKFGVAAYARRTPSKSRIYAYEQEQESELSADEIAALRKAGNAWEYLQSTAPSYRKVVLNWVVRAKKPETRISRFRKLLQACQAGERLR
jgi:uncharacterized protein YdeI (YjbR/CyaY-like superfamily)